MRTKLYGFNLPSNSEADGEGDMVISLDNLESLQKIEDTKLRLIMVSGNVHTLFCDDQESRDKAWHHLIKCWRQDEEVEELKEMLKSMEDE